MALLMQLSRSGSYAWRKRPASKRDVANAAFNETVKSTDSGFWTRYL